MILFKHPFRFGIFILFVFQSFAIGQDSTAGEFEHMRLPVISNDADAKYDSFEDQVAFIISKTARQLGLYDIIVVIEIDSAQTHADTSIQADINDLSALLDKFLEAIVIVEANISQKGVPFEEEQTFFSFIGRIFRPGREADANNVRTDISVLASYMDIETGEFLGHSEVAAAYTGGNREKSKEKALEKFRNKIAHELKRIYWYSSDIVSAETGMITLDSATSLGVEKDLVFEIVEPDRILTDDDGEFIVPGGVVGYASVSDTTRENIRLRILRQWRDHNPGSWVVESTSPKFALQLSYTGPPTHSYVNWNLLFQAAPLYRYDWGIGVNIIRVTDSFGDKDWGFGFNAFGMWRFINKSKIDVGGKCGVDIDIPFRNDDDRQLVNTLLFSANIALVAEFLISRKSDLVFSTGYRSGIKSSEWDYSVEEEQYPAFWEKDPPEVNNTGFFLSVGYKFNFY